MADTPENAAQLIPVDAFDMVIFGGTGDLALRKILPALFHRWQDNQIPERSRIVATARQDMSEADFRAHALEKFREFRPKETVSDEDWGRFCELLHYLPLDATNADAANWTALASQLKDHGDKQRIFYLALPPGLFGPVSENIGKAGLAGGEARIVLEKPIGTDLESAKQINEAVGRVFPEECIFRIDHYLGKETVQNLLVLRFTNSLFEPLLNARHVDHVQITVAETVGAGQRAAYYDKAGALRDMVQNHLLQLLCLTAMEPPVSFDADMIRDEKIKVLRALRPITRQDVQNSTVRGQYDKGVVDGQSVPGYADELGGATNAETFVAIKADINNWRWAGVPFYIRTGKRMSGRWSEIVIQFKQIKHELIKSDVGDIQPTRLIIRLQPNEGVRLMLMTKDPGPGGMRLRYVPLNLSYRDTFEVKYPDAYERLLMAVVRNNLSLFMRRDEVEAAWHWIDAIQEAWAQTDQPALPYTAGSDGPMKSSMLLAGEEREWLDNTAEE